MKKMTCSELGGACDLEFKAETFDEMAEMSKNHGMEMFQKGDQPHLDAMDKMKDLMKEPDAIEKWFEEKKKQFEEAPEV
jgi:uncharacterized iron-regulated protein